MRVADEAEALEALEDADELSRVGVDVIGKDVFIDRPSWRSVNCDEFIRAHAHGKITEELPALRLSHRIGIVLKLLPSPEASLLGAGVEVERLVKHREIVIAHERGTRARHHQVQAL